MLTMFIIIIIKKCLPGMYLPNNTNIPHSVSLQIIARTLFFLLIFLPSSGSAQQYNYSINKSGKKIGTLSVKCIKSDKRIIYSIWSEAKTGFIININVNIIIEEIFEMGEMVHSTFIRKINGLEMIKNTADKIKQGYLLNNNGDDNKFIPSKINYSMGAMYFIEPANQEFVYSEYYQQFIPVTPSGKNRYLINFPDGNKSYYTYDNGICTEVEIHTNWIVLFLNLKSINSGSLKHSLSIPS